MTTVGITATREGLTPQQKQVLTTYLTSLHVEEGHHGDCVGGDEDFHEICNDLSIPIVIHPPEDERLRAFCSRGVLRTWPVLPYLARNKVIVNSIDLLFGCPKEEEEPAPARGQGTWSTIRYARRIHAPVKVIYPSGRIIE